MAASKPSTESTASEKNHFYDAKFQNVDDRLTSVEESNLELKSDVAAVKAEMSSNHKELTGLLNIGLGKLYDRIEVKSSAPLNLINKDMLAILVIGVGALWATIGLLVNPIARSQEATATSLLEVAKKVNSDLPLIRQRADDNRSYFEAGLETADHESRLRDDAQQVPIDNLLVETKEFRAWQLAMAEWKGETKKDLFYLRDDTLALKGDARVHESMSHHPTSNVHALEGRLEALEENLRRVDTQGSTGLLKLLSEQGRKSEQRVGP